MQELDRDDNVLRIVSVFVLCAVVLALGHKSLVDVDLGWHLAGGLWMLKTHVVPHVDPFAFPANQWTDYSWLFQVLIAVVFRGGGFFALQIFQTLMIATSVIALWMLALSVLSDFSSRSRNLLALIGVLCSLFFVAPVWHLRPQLVSLIFFCLLLYWIRSERVIYRYVFLSLIWANIHVYWIMVPFVVLLNGILRFLIEKRQEAFFKALLLAASILLVGIVSPYGFDNLACLWRYLTDHSVAYSLIREFQPLQPTHGLAFWLFLLSIVAITFFAQRIVQEVETLYVVLLGGTAFLSFMQIKYLPLYGVLFAIVFSKGILSCVFEFKGKCETNTRGSSATGNFLALSLIGFFVALVVSGQKHSRALTPRHEELFAALKVISESETSHIVLNHFDDGGWLALGTLLFNMDRTRTTYDGRTLVMGEERLREFNRLQFKKSDWCEIVKKTKADAAILPVDFQLSKAIREGECGEPWSLVFEGTTITALMKP